MTVYDLIKSYDKKELIEWLVVFHPYLFFPDYATSYRYYSIGIDNLMNADYTENDNVVNIEQIMDLEPMCIVSHPNDNERYAFGPDDWSKMLGTQIGDSIDDSNKRTFVLLLIKELLFFGNSEEMMEKRVTKLNEELREQANKPMNGTPAEDVFKEIKKMIGKAPATPKVGEVYQNIEGIRYTVVAVGRDISKELTMICLQGEQETLMLTIDQMLWNIEDVKFSDGKSRKARFERVE